MARRVSMVRSSFIFSFVLLGAVAACTGRDPKGHDAGDDPSNEDAGGRVDSGRPGTDAGIAPTDGGFEPTCTDECASGSQSCDGTDQYRVCGQYDLDACLELSPPIHCAESYTCTGDRCVPPCRDECPAMGSICMGETTRLVCGNFDTDTCREPGSPIACGAGERCEAGACVPSSSTCTDECPTAGATLCFGDAVRTCGRFDSDSCLDLGAPVACGPGEICNAGACAPYCVDECRMGARECVGDGFRECGNHDADGCLEWGATTACGGGESCSGGACSATCENDCSSLGGAVCTPDGLGVATCGSFDSDSCNDVSSAIYCPLGFRCASGVCVASCTNDCTPGDAPRCAPGSAAVQTCGNYDADVCFEWGGDAMCAGGASCTSGSCDTPCTQECPTAGATECVAGSNAVRTCGQYDTDACREWSTPSACASYQTCTAGACTLGMTPATILINEIAYDSPGVDGDANNTLFVELWGPAGTSLDGWELVGVDGGSGADYNRIALDGEAIGPDGWFLIAHPMGATELRDAADMTSVSVDYQNGPDSVQLRWRGRVVDALGYGTFGTGTTFRGEGMPISGVSAGSSLTRNEAHADTNVNSADFSAASVPSPRAAVASCSHECPTAGATQCSGANLQTCGNYDADPCREWSTPAACPTAGQACVAGVCTTAPCTDECPMAGAKQCSGIQVQTCVSNYDADSCLEWNAPAGCPNAGEQCTGAGVCTIPCTDDCPSMGARQCSGSQVQTCGNYDADACREWSAGASCPGASEVCTGAGVCSTPCTDECPAMGTTRCSGTQQQTCGNYDTDACREWSAAAACPMGQLCGGTACRDASAPEVVLITPMGTIQTTQGNMHRMVVDATPAPGRSIAQVRYFANGMMVGSTTVAPHEFVYTVPPTAMTGSSIAVYATAVDNAGSVGTSASATLNVRNDVPVASFTATITNVSTVTVDASGSHDTETPITALEFCWDWNNDGTCETPFSTTKITTHDFGASGMFTIGMKVRDAVGQIASTTRTVTFTDIQYVGGVTLMSTLWYGTVIITGDVTVGSGQTLTIAPGTNVLFVRADVDAPAGVGDYALFVSGALVVNGTAMQPVVFSGQDMAGHTPGAWDRIQLVGSAPSTFHYAIVEYADVGIDVRNASTFDHVTVRNTRSECVLLNNADNATFTDSITTQCGGNGITALGGSTGVMFTRHTSTENGRDGLNVSGVSAVSLTGANVAHNLGSGAVADGSALNVSDSVVEVNTATGLSFLGNATGMVTHNNVRSNGAEGLSLRTGASGDPTPVVQLNNFYSNATTGSLVVTTASPSLSASHTCCDSTGNTSAVYTAPAGKTIYRARITYNENDGGSYVNGYLETGTGTSLRMFTANYDGWVFLPPGTTSIRVRVSDSGYSYTADTITVGSAELAATSGTADVMAATSSGTADLRFNFLGTFPNVLSRVTMTRNDALNVQGFVGSAFDDTWSTRNFKAGTLMTQAWSGKIYITGDITIGAGQAVTAAPDTEILFVNHDQNLDMRGDFTLTANGRFDLQGAMGTPVRIAGHGSPTGDAFQAIVLAGTTTNASTWSYVDASRGLNAVRITGSSSLDNCNITGGSGAGIVLRNAAGATLTNSRVTGSTSDGVLLDNADNATLTRVTAESNMGDGFEITNGSTGLNASRITSRQNSGRGVVFVGGSGGMLTDSTIRENGSHGLVLTDSSPTVDYNLITYNQGIGIFVSGNSTASAQYNVIKFNDDSGVAVNTDVSGSPTPTIQNSNIYGNTTTGTTRTTTASAGLSASYTCCGSSSTSATYTAPAGSTIRRIMVSYTENDVSSYVNGALLTGDGTPLRAFTTSFSGWVALPAGTTSVKVTVSDTGYSYTADTISATTVELSSRNPMDHYELTASTDTGTTLARYNYWTATIADVPSKIFQARAGSVDYSGFTGIELPSGSVTQVGPRP